MTDRERDEAIRLARLVAADPQAYTLLERELAGAVAMLLQELHLSDTTLRLMVEVSNDVLRKDIP